MDYTKENLSTIAVFIYMLISPLLTKCGIDINQTSFTTIMIGLSGLILAIYSAKNPNNLKKLGNDNNESC